MRNNAFYVINGITLYRLVAAPFLIFLVVTGWFELFKWLLLLSFFSDAVDGYLARKYKVSSSFGARLDSIADDCTILAAIVAMCVQHALFLLYEIIPVAMLFVLYLAEIICAVYRYKRPTSFHTYAAKLAAVSQAIFLLAFFFLPQPVYWLFYVMVFLTILDLAEEIVLIFLLREYLTDVKGIYWILKARKKGS
ncbi:CDP-alcohol phosphatidyltransferase family protein [Mucilaginibacter sp.]|jgi:CDP-diacylglycerol--glycerol-3-phosphate 3-phosphatidyltransferase|uniref:CDP-alcohol phosphatidyltransferase family protein n=1 Tax=Mucilaginibacter sp. TaxID=1882438 RepID=UPI002CFD7E17|nr:CDP-alcohol phosphatidyltransferase family protein [Mucilaginibacter sp.]HTI60236.1 CDP-alcohol phosphatidyltransferase family protein [Mucilaginibacter sp.]